MNGLDKLRSRYPWPPKPPAVAKDYFDHLPSGWCCQENLDMFARLCDADTKVVIELGSWMGRSTMAIAGAAPSATLLCVDHWKGSTEHHIREEWREKLPVLYETFLVHLWEHRARVVPVRNTTLAGMEEIHAAGIVPDVVYVDASHDARSVDADVRTAIRLFPKAAICGDDWTHATVCEGVCSAIVDSPYTLHHDRVCWWLE